MLISSCSSNWFFSSCHATKLYRIWKDGYDTIFRFELIVLVDIKNMPSHLNEVDIDVFNTPCMQMGNSLMA